MSSLQTVLIKWFIKGIQIHSDHINLSPFLKGIQNILLGFFFFLYKCFLKESQAYILKSACLGHYKQFLESSSLCIYLPHNELIHASLVSIINGLNMVVQLQGAQSNLPFWWTFNPCLSLNSHIIEGLEYQALEGMIKKKIWSGETRGNKIEI